MLIVRIVHLHGIVKLWPFYYKQYLREYTDKRILWYLTKNVAPSKKML